MRGYVLNKTLEAEARKEYQARVDELDVKAMEYLAKLDRDFEEGIINGRQFSIANRQFLDQTDEIGRARRAAHRKYRDRLAGSAIPI